MSVLANHLQYLENMVLILNSINSIPVQSSQSSRQSLPASPASPASSSPSFFQVSTSSTSTSASSSRSSPSSPSSSTSSISPTSSRSSASSRLPLTSPPLVRSQPYGLLGQMISQSVRSYLIHEVESMLNELSARDIGVQLLSRVFDVHEYDDWEGIDDAIINLEVIMRDEVVNDTIGREYHPDHLSNAGEFVQKCSDDHDCSICFESLKDEEMFKTRCGHTYHPKCLHSWLNRKQNCPVCRANF